MRTQRVQRNTSVVMALLNLALVFLVFAGVHRLETALYDRCVERQQYDAAVEQWRAVVVEQARLEAQRESNNRFVDQLTRDERAASSMRIVAAGEKANESVVRSSCTRLRLLGLGRIAR